MKEEFELLKLELKANLVDEIKRYLPTFHALLDTNESPVDIEGETGALVDSLMGEIQ